MGNVCGVNKKGRKAKRDIITGRPIPPREPIHSFSCPREHSIQNIKLPSLQPPVNISPREEEKGIPVSEKELRVGYYFMVDELLGQMLKQKSLLQKNRSRLTKWHSMAAYQARSMGHKQINLIIVDGSSGKSSRVQSASTAVSDNDVGADNAEFRGWLDGQRVILNEKLAQQGLRLFYKEHPDKFLARLRKGPPAEYRWLAWKVVTKKPNVNLEYEELVKAPENKWTNQIRRDIDRTFPNLAYFADTQSNLGMIGQAALFRTLCAYSTFNPRVGYCQSMNFILALFLLISGGRQHQAFDMFVMITQNSYSDHRELSLSGLEGLYQDQFPALSQYKFYFFSLFKRKLPKLYDHFIQQGIPDGLWIDKWFLTLFLYQLPLGLVIRVWDNLLAQGLVFMFQMAMALLKFSEKELLSLDQVGVLEYIRGIGKRQDQAGVMQVGKGVLMPDGTFSSPYQVLPSNIETIIKKANEIKISLSELQQIKMEFKQSQASKGVQTKKFNAFGHMAEAKITKIEEVKSEREQDRQDQDEEPMKIQDLNEDEDQDEKSREKKHNFHEMIDDENEKELKEALRPQRTESPELGYKRVQPKGSSANVEFRSSIVKGIQEEAKLSQQMKKNQRQEEQESEEPVFKASPVASHIQQHFNPRLLEDTRSGFVIHEAKEQRKAPSSPHDTPDQLSLSETQEQFNRTQSIANSYNYSLSKRSSSRGAIAFPGSNHPSLSQASRDNITNQNIPNMVHFTSKNGGHRVVQEWGDLQLEREQEDQLERTGHIGSDSSGASSEVPHEETWLQQSGQLQNGHIPEDIQSQHTEQEYKTDRIKDLTEDAIEFVSASHGWAFFPGENPLSGFKQKKPNQESPMTTSMANGTDLFQASKSVHHPIFTPARNGNLGEWEGDVRLPKPALVSDAKSRQYQTNNFFNHG